MNLSDNILIGDTHTKDEPIVFDLQLDEFGFISKPFRKQFLFSSILKASQWIGAIVEAIFLILNFPDYDATDWLSLIVLTIFNIALFANYAHFKKIKRFRYFHFDEEKIEYWFNIFNFKSFKWEEIRKIVIWTDSVEVFLKKTRWNPHTIPMQQITFQEREARQNLKLAIRALCIKLKIPFEERPDCAKERAINQKLKKQLMKKSKKKN